MDYPNKAGESYRNTLLSVQRQASKAGRPFDDAELRLPINPPRAGEYVWDAFLALNRSRAGTGYGPAPIPNQEIYAWTLLYQQPLEIWEVNAIRAMDVAYLEEVSKLQKEEE